MSQIVNQGPTLEEEVRADIAAIRELPARTQGRRVGSIIQDYARSQELADRIISIAQGWEKVIWTRQEALELEQALEAEESRLDRWVTKMSSRLGIRS